MTVASRPLSRAQRLRTSLVQAFRDAPKQVQAGFHAFLEDHCQVAVMETCPDLEIKPTNDGRHVPDGEHSKPLSSHFLRKATT